MIGIYKITNPKGNIYIGQSWNIETRKSSYKNCRPGQPYIFNSIKKYGWENHKFEFVVKIQNDTLVQKGVEKLEKLGIDRIIVEKFLNSS